MRKILIVGAGQSGLQLAHGLLAEGYEVTIMSAHTPDEIRNGWPTSTQAMFAPALDAERRYELNLWDDQAPQIAGLRVNLSAPPGTRALDVIAELERPAQSTDQRLKMAAWLELAEHRGATVVHNTASAADLDTLTTDGHHDLTIVAAGRSDLAAAFDRDPVRSLHTTPQRGLAIAYVHGLAPDPDWPAPHVGFHAVPGLGELFVIPALTQAGACDILFWEAVPGQDLDRWPTNGSRVPPTEHLQTTLDLAKQYVPWVYERCRNVELTDAKATLHGRFTPTVRKPVAHLPSGGVALGMADVVITNDPITGQGSNTAARCADHYLRAILAHGDRPFDTTWMRDTFESFWATTAHAVTAWTNAMLQPLPEHVQQILATAATNPEVARRFAAGFADPTTLTDWFMTPTGAADYLASTRA